MFIRTVILAVFLPIFLLAGENPKTVLEALPSKIAECTRGEIHKYEEAELGCSTAYRAEGMVLTVFVYDQGHAKIAAGLEDPVVKEAFAASVSELKAAVGAGYYKDLEILDNGMARLGGKHDVLRTRFTLTRLKGADAGRKCFSDIYLWGAAGNIVKVRVTGYVEDALKHAKTIERFIPALAEALPKPPKGR